MAATFGVSVGTIKRAISELQGAGLLISRQGQGEFVRSRRSLLEAVPHLFSAEAIAGAWVTAYRFRTEAGAGCHADITQVTAQSSRRWTGTNYPPEPRTKGYSPAFRNDIEAQVVNRHVVGTWRNSADTRYFGSLQLALLPGEAVMEGYYTAFLTDIEVDADRWRWVRLDSASLAGRDLANVELKQPDALYDLVYGWDPDARIPLSALTEGNN